MMLKRSSTRTSAKMETRTCSLLAKRADKTSVQCLVVFCIGGVLEICVVHPNKPNNVFIFSFKELKVFHGQTLRR